MKTEEDAKQVIEQARQLLLSDKATAKGMQAAIQAVTSGNTLAYKTVSLNVNIPKLLLDAVDAFCEPLDMAPEHFLGFMLTNHLTTAIGAMAFNLNEAKNVEKLPEAQELAARLQGAVKKLQDLQTQLDDVAANIPKAQKSVDKNSK